METAVPLTCIACFSCVSLYSNITGTETQMPLMSKVALRSMRAVYDVCRLKRHTLACALACEKFTYKCMLGNLK